MSAIMSQLHLDHLNLSRVLEVLKDKLVSLKAGERPDYTAATVCSHVYS